MASPPPEIRGVFTAMNTGPFIISVDDWQLLLNIQASQTSKCFIEDVIHYKCTEGKEHEFLRLQISHPSGPWKAFVFCDRTVNTSNDNGDPVQSHRAALLCSSSLPSTPSFGNFPAMDIIYAASANSTALKQLYLGRFSDKHTHVRTLTYNTKGAQPSVLDLAMLLKLFPDHRTSTSTHKGGTYRNVDVPMADSVEKEIPREHSCTLSMSGSSFLVWATAQEPYRRIPIDGKLSSESQGSRDKEDSGSIATALWNAWDLLLNVHGIGWNWSRGPILPKPVFETHSRTAFVLWSEVCFAFHFLAYDATAQVIRMTSPENFTSVTGASISDPSLPPVWQLWQPLRRVTTSTLVMLMACFAMESCHILLAILFVTVFQQHPSQWPPLFDSP
ncbi:hypothetical protein BU15DRAFT_78103 [Melanogaster broomeanus]|nr:hypothetical protein BU15DRAFT_78103 [Melanogaster broomeanus]